MDARDKHGHTGLGCGRTPVPQPGLASRAAVGLSRPSMDIGVQPPRFRTGSPSAACSCNRCVVVGYPSSRRRTRASILAAMPSAASAARIARRWLVKCAPSRRGACAATCSASAAAAANSRCNPSRRSNSGTAAPKARDRNVADRSRHAVAFPQPAPPQSDCLISPSNNGPRPDFGLLSNTPWCRLLPVHHQGWPHSGVSPLCCRQPSTWALTAALRACACDRSAQSGSSSGCRPIACCNAFAICLLYRASTAQDAETRRLRRWPQSRYSAFSPE